jgi:hypothetical protein
MAGWTKAIDPHRPVARRCGWCRGENPCAGVDPRFNRTTWSLTVTAACLMLGLSSVGPANAQGVDERMTTGAPPSGSYAYPPPSPARKPNAVPTAPRSYLSREPHAYGRKPSYDYWDWSRSEARKLKRR